MKIITGGKKDYYDYLSGIYGIDNDVVYDRRNSTVFRRYYDMDTYFVKDILCNDKQKELKRTHRFIDNRWKFEYMPEGNIYFILIEIGYTQYFFSIERYLDDNNKVVINPTLIEKKNVTEKKSEAPISVIPIICYYSYRSGFEISKYLIHQEVQNPIFSGTWVTTVIAPDEIYQNVYDYLISIREPNIVDKRNDIQKLESKGFDKKTSFRNPVINANSKKKK